MSKKNRKNQSSLKAAKVQPFTEETKAQVDLFKEDVEKSATADADEAEMGYGDIEMLKSSIENQDIVTYLNKLEKMHRILIASQRKADEDKKEAADKVKDADNKLNEAKNKLAEAEEEKKSLEAEKENYRQEIDKEYDAKLKECNDREQKVLERELTLDNGKHSEIMADLLESFRSSQEKVFEDSKKLAEEIAGSHSDITKKYEDVFEKQQELHQRSTDLDKREKNLNRREAIIEADSEGIREDIKEDLEDEYRSKIDELKHKNVLLEARYRRLEDKRDRISAKYDSICSGFASESPEEMLDQLSTLKSDIARLRQKLDESPSKSDYDSLQERYQEALADNRSLREKQNEEERLKLKNMLSNADSFQVELSAKDKELRTARFQLETYKTALESMQSAIETMKGEKEKNNKAFEFSYRYDNDKEIQGTTLSPTTPHDLAELCDYLQRSMATKDRPFYYDKATIASFLAGLNMSGLTILQGISGTGKTSLPREIARTLLCSPHYKGENKAPYRICAIQSGWRDNMDLMGYYNAFEHKYNETDFFKALYLAGLPKYKDTLFFIILDEMNLSHPEHYFADFLSLLEQPENERFISVKAPEEVWPKAVTDGRLTVPQNVRFIGTANQDETTLEFAPKTYDRSNLLELPKNHPTLNVSSPNKKYNVSYPWIKSKFEEAEETYKAEIRKFTEFITTNNEFHRIMSEKGIGWGNRFEDQAKRFIPAYIACRPVESSSICLAEAADHLLTTRLLRPLQNHFELQPAQLDDFKTKYRKIFNNAFSQDPNYAVHFIEELINKKRSDENL